MGRGNNSNKYNKKNNVIERHNSRFGLVCVEKWRHILITAVHVVLLQRK